MFSASLLFLLIKCIVRITSGHYANIGEKYTLFKDWEPPKTIPNPAPPTYIGVYSPAYSYRPCWSWLQSIIQYTEIQCGTIQLYFTRGSYKEGGGSSGKVHERKKLRIMNHGYKNFVFQIHENKQVRNSYLFKLTTFSWAVFEESKITNGVSIVQITYLGRSRQTILAIRRPCVWKSRIVE